ncbi:MAG: hypothetical protein GC193_13100 [Cryomorphaceae bacterium]|nr:hypothetical protein [Cryomorphaceae bacterium]
MKKLILLVFFAPLFSHAQLELREPGTPEEMVSEFLLGNGILVSNVVFSGFDGQRTAFAGGEFMGLDSGIVLSSAIAENVISGGGNEVPFGSGVYEDIDLLSVAQSVPALIGQGFTVSAVNDIAALDFDFIPFGDNLSFSYSFGSDEYLTWINSPFNDVFGFFVSGPGISGPYSNGAINVAVVPDSDPALPITVSSVNPNINSELYINNPLNQNIFINGYTTVLTAELNGLQIGETYHIRLAIADGSDSALESVVLLKAGSFTSVIPVAPGGPGDFNGDGYADVSDLLILIADYGCEASCTADINGDGITNVLDILAFLQLFE